MSKTILQVTVEFKPMVHENQESIPRAEYFMVCHWNHGLQGMSRFVDIYIPWTVPLLPENQKLNGLDRKSK